MSEPQRVTLVAELPAGAVNEVMAGDRLRVYRRSVTEVSPGVYRVVIEVARMSKR